MVYLDTTTDLLVKNIENRGREIEKKLKKSYLEKLKKSLDTYYMFDGKVNTTVLILTIKEYNVAILPQCCKEITEIIEKTKK